MRPWQLLGSHWHPPQPAEKRGAQLLAPAHFGEGMVLEHKDLLFGRCVERRSDDGSLKPPQEQSGEH